ncbi:NnrS family protein [Pseudomonas paeninsulae]|uniref:NnrS family protein n=1 Tax=Pseudomonas paeninsulae TaxID=3110772 RepID=UPI002D772A81|nr:NnrS family protein [Pseudomonas sp. IT1137]
MNADRPPAFANAWFFPAAAVYAALLLPLSVLGLLDHLPPLPGLVSAAGHAHEMLFGFALAVVAGYLLGPQPRAITLGLLTCWLAARLLFLFWPGSWAAGLAAALFAAGLSWKVVPRFLGVAKKWRNQMVAPLVAGLALLSVLIGPPYSAALTPALLREALLLFATLLFFMGGRIIVPALAGYAQSQGRTLDARVQPRLEGGILTCLLLALLLAPWPWPQAGQASGLLLIGAGLLALLRLLRWRPWLCWRRADLLVLLVGYAWLIAGLLLVGLTLAGTPLPLDAALHAIGVGALGTLTLGVMARTRLLYRFRDANAQPWVHSLAGLLSAAALARILPPLLGQPDPAWLLFAAGCWSLAFGALPLLFWQTRGAHPHSRRSRRPAAAPP